MSFHYNSNAIVLLDYKEFLFFFILVVVDVLFFKMSVHSQIVIDACSHWSVRLSVCLSQTTCQMAFHWSIFAPILLCNEMSTIFIFDE